jgi:hypothetical protein
MGQCKNLAARVRLLEAFDVSHPRDRQHFCVLPWTHLSLRPQGELRPCCNYMPKKQFGLHRVSAAEYFHGETLRDLRARMARGEKVNECRRCFDQEDIGFRSLRQWSNDAAEAYGFDENDPQVRFVEFSKSNKCNLNCLSCDPTASSRWADALSVPIRNPALRFEDLEHATHIRFGGGEPFLEPENERFLARQIEIHGDGKLDLIYTTNMTIKPPASVLALWKRTRSVLVSASVDGHGELCEYIRHPMKWPVFERNLRALYEMRGDLPLSFQGGTTVSILNVNKLVELDRWFAEAVPELRPRKEVLVRPEPLSLLGIPRALREDLVMKLHNGMASLPAKYRDTYLPAVNELMREDELPTSDVWNYLGMLEKLFGIEKKWGDVNPDLARALEPWRESADPAGSARELGEFWRSLLAGY